MLRLFKAVADQFGVEADIDDTAIRLPTIGRAICDSAHINAHRDAGWQVEPVPATFADIVSKLAAAGGHSSDPQMLARAVTAILDRMAVTDIPKVSADGRLLRWDDAQVVIVASGRAPTLDGYTVHSLGGQLARALTQLRAAALNLLAAASRHEATNPSSHEARVAKALLAIGLPPPARDLKLRRNGGTGSVYSQPDFAWPEVRLLLDLDGWYFHAATALDILLTGADADGARKALISADRTRLEKDASKRRMAAVDGWTVMTCTDVEIDRDGTERIARDVAAVYRRLCTVPDGSTQRCSTST